MEKIVFTREELYEMVWITPLSQLAKKYNITDNGLRKMCAKMAIPLPDNGYWLKLKYNKTVKKKPLPTNYTGDKKEVSLTEKEIDNPPDNSPISIQKALIKSYETLDSSLFKVPDKLTNPDKLIIDKQKVIAASNSRNYSFFEARNYAGSLELSASEENLSRAFRIFDTIIKLLKYRKHDVIIENRKTYAVVFDEKIEIALREKYRTEIVIDKSWNHQILHPTGKLIFRIDRLYLKEFVDGNELLEDKIKQILAYLEYWGQKEKERHLEWERHRLEEAERQRIEKEKKERKELELNNFKLLLKESKSWHKSLILENYLKEVEQRAIEHNTLTDELKTWLIWAKQKADWYNPFIKKEDVFLTEKDRILL